MEVLKAMKAGGKAPHAFGEANWWGKDLWGIDNALVIARRDGKLLAGHDLSGAL